MGASDMKYSLKIIVIVVAMFLCGQQVSAQAKTDGQEGAFVGQVMFSVIQIFPAGTLEKLKLSDEQRKQLNIDGNKTVGAPRPLEGARIKLGSQESYSNTEGFFSFNSIPVGITEGTIFSEGTIFDEKYKSKPMGKFSVSKLVKRGSGKIEPIVIKLPFDVASHLAGMEYRPHR